MAKCKTTQTSQLKPIEFMMKTQYGATDIQIQNLNDKFFAEVDKMPSKRGATKKMVNWLNEKFPGFTEQFPIKGWEQREKMSDGTYKFVVVDKDFESAMATYSKSITVAVSKYGPNTTGKSFNTSMSQQLGIPDFIESAPEPMTDEMALVSKLKECGVKSYKRQADGSLEVQF